MNNIILLGLPGAGKGVQGKQLASRLGVPHISIGDIVRELVRVGTPLGHEIAESWKSTTGWAPLADPLATRVVQESVAGLDGFVLDGFPRNVVQAQSVDFQVDAVIFLDASPEVCRTRVLGRGREGDSAVKFEQRLAAERERLPALLKYIRSHWRLITVDADQMPAAVSASINHHLGLEPRKEES